MHKGNCFLTLTYDNEHLPEDWSVDVKAWQDFAKRLRKRIGPFRYFHCGEYGDANLRPHYHACIFGADFASSRYRWSGSGDRQLYRSPVLDDAWGQGHAVFGSLTYQSAAYVARYVMKKRTGPQASEFYKRVNPDTGEEHQVKPEYVTMSRRPGIGSTWFDRYVDDVYPHDNVVHEGKKFRPPRYYDAKLPESTLDALKAKRRDAAHKYKEDLTPERLRVREQVARSRLKHQARNI